MTVEALSYAIDDEDRLIRVDDGYYRFAAENGWNGAGDSLGRSLWDFVAGHDVKKLQRLLLRRVREGVRGIELPFRCDGPDVIREMDIRIAADSSGRVVLFSAKMRREEGREEPQPLLDPEAPREEGDFLQMCAWCDRFLVDGEWVEVEEAAKRLELFRRSRLPTLDHGICPQCSGQLLAA
ncbi:MAG TPA: hypothetical protein VFI09_05595 [Solirubrobacterales bacterium]|nr:hypothetical protein [Solirubrobacterales bacterium]